MGYSRLAASLFQFPENGRCFSRALPSQTPGLPLPFDSAFGLLSFYTPTQ
jgi:hypothetical protein